MPEIIRDLSSDKTVRCEACGNFFLKTDNKGIHVRCFGLCTRCFDYYDGMQKWLEEMYAKMEE